MNRFDISHAPDIVRVSKARVNVVPAHYEFDRTIFLSDSHRADLGPRAQEHARPPASRGTDGEAKVDKEKRKKNEIMKRTDCHSIQRMNGRIVAPREERPQDLSGRC